MITKIYVVTKSVMYILIGAEYDNINDNELYVCFIIRLSILA